MQTQTLYFHFKGGIISPGMLSELLAIAAEARVTHVRFGLRQQLIMDVPEVKYPAFAISCINKQIHFYKEGDTCPTLVSSYAGTNIFTPESWLRESVYKDVFDLFNYPSILKINICEGKQSHTPLFSGHLNWISSNHLHYWWLVIRIPGTSDLLYWPELIYTNDLAHLSRQLEALLVSAASPEEKTIDFLFRKLKSEHTVISKKPSGPFSPPMFHLPYYEGFNKDGERYWLGVYRRDELFPVALLQEICRICIRTMIGEIYITSWKSLVIKGIEAVHRGIWDHVLGKFRINVRHAANELNWQVEDNCEDGLVLKRHVIRYFDKEDVRTYGLCFAVKTRPASSVFGSVVIRRQQRKNLNRLKSMERYDILYTRDFNPNSMDYISFREGVEKEQLGPYIVSLCKYYYEWSMADKAGKEEHVVEAMPSEADQLTKTVFQCKHCYTVYDETIGDEANHIPAGTSSQQLPDNYECSVCGSGKSEFIPIDARRLLDA